jgi:hypothetical protein
MIQTKAGLADTGWKKEQSPGKEQKGTNGLISFSGESAEKPAKTK